MTALRADAKNKGIDELEGEKTFYRYVQTVPFALSHAGPILSFAVLTCSSLSPNPSTLRDDDNDDNSQTASESSTSPAPNSSTWVPPPAKNGV